VDFVSWGQSTSFAPRVFGFFLVFFPLARRRFWHRKVYCFTCVMAAEINSKYKKISQFCSSCYCARAHVCVSGFYRFLKLVSYFDMPWCILQTIVMLLWKSLSLLCSWGLFEISITPVASP
jgi:hypothetical protein